MKNNIQTLPTSLEISHIQNRNFEFWLLFYDTLENLSYHFDSITMGYDTLHHSKEIISPLPTYYIFHAVGNLLFFYNHKFSSVDHQFDGYIHNEDFYDEFCVFNTTTQKFIFHSPDIQKFAAYLLENSETKFYTYQ